MGFFNVSNGGFTPWKSYEKTALRFFIIYFGIQVLPLNAELYHELFSLNWRDGGFYGLFLLTRYMPQFFALTGFENWAVAAALAVAGTAVWSALERKETDYNILYYWLRAVLRYRLAIGIIAYGLIKLFPLQMPFPSLSNLYTNYGQFSPWKIYFHTIGITQWYESFLGAVEILAGLLLFFRRTTTFGAGIILGFIGNVLFANNSYNMGEQVYCAYLLAIALFLFAYDVPRLYKLLFLETYTQAAKFQPVFGNTALRRLRTAFKTAFVLFVILLGAKTYGNYRNGPYKLPRTQGISGTYGFYNVREFKFNNTTIPYSVTDPNRWQNVVFEQWATISIKIARPLKLDESRGDGFYQQDIDRDYESAGIGDRRYFAYQADTLSKTLRLKNKNKNHAAEQFLLTYTRLNDSTIVLRGVNEHQDSVYAVLDRINKKHLLFVGRRKPLKL